MAQKEVNSLLAKPVALAAGIVGLIQGLAWIVFSVLCICCYTEAIKIDPLSLTNSTDYYKYIYWTFLNPGIDSPHNLLVEPREFFIFMWFYLIFSLIWTLVSGSVIWAMCHNQWHLIKHLFGAWSIVTVLISLVDVVLTSLIARDYKEVTDFFESSSQLIDQMIIVCYGIVMTLTARGFILWIVNIVFATVMAKFVIDVIKDENNGARIPIIHGYESSDVTPPWFNSSAKGLWVEPPTPQINGSYSNHGFTRSHSFFPDTRPDSRDSDAYVDHYNNTKLPSDNYNSFAASIANKVATIGRNKGRRSPNNVSPPMIPDPDYTPPSSPNGLKSVLRSKSNYQ